MNTGVQLASDVASVSLLMLSCDICNIDTDIQNFVTSLQVARREHGDSLKDLAGQHAVTCEENSVNKFHAMQWQWHDTMQAHAHERMCSCSQCRVL